MVQLIFEQIGHLVDCSHRDLISYVGNDLCTVLERESGESVYPLNPLDGLPQQSRGAPKTHQRLMESPLTTGLVY